MSDILLFCKEMIKTFGHGDSKVLALRGVTLDVYEEELLMLVGPSGCGKTTFISCMSGLLSIDSGSCIIFKKNIDKMNDDELVLFRREHIGFVFQSFNLLTALSAVENVALPLTVAGIKDDEAYSKAKELLDAVGLTSKYNTKPANLSGGQQQRIAIARALIHNPKLIICDEPTSSLDHHAGEIVMKLLQKIQQEHQATVIVVTHDDRIYRYADAIAYMEDGRITKVKRRNG